MSNYFAIQPMGEGTEDIEQFHSYFYRFAAAHGTTMIPMAKHLEQWWARTHRRRIALNEVFLYKANRIALCGYGDAVVNYVEVVSEASHQPHLYRTTLLPIREAADANTHGAIRKGRAWCPACMYWARKNGEIYYDRLLWAMAAIVRCPKHQVKLVIQCPSCNSPQLAYAATAGMDSCAKCLQPLVQGPATWERMDQPSFGEKDCQSLVAAISDGSLVNAVPRAFGIFTEELRALTGPILAYRKFRTARIRTLPLRQHRPKLSTMLRRCLESGVRLSDVLTDPRGAALAAGELIFDNYGLPKEKRESRGQDLHRLARNLLIEALAGLPLRPIVSFKKFADELGVSPGFLRYREPALSKVYIFEHKRQVARENRMRKRLAKVDLTMGGALLRYLSGQYRSQDELVDYLNVTFDVQKHVARRLVSDALLIHTRMKALSVKSRLAHNERIMLKRGRDSGYL